MRNGFGRIRNQFHILYDIKVSSKTNFASANEPVQSQSEKGTLGGDYMWQMFHSGAQPRWPLVIDENLLEISIKSPTLLLKNF